MSATRAAALPNVVLAIGLSEFGAELYDATHIWPLSPFLPSRASWRGSDEEYAEACITMKDESAHECSALVRPLLKALAKGEIQMTIIINSDAFGVKNGRGRYEIYPLIAAPDDALIAIQFAKQYDAIVSTSASGMM
jgi:hypothetical protein